MSSSSLDIQALQSPDTAQPAALVPWLELLAGAVRRAPTTAAPPNSEICLKQFGALLDALGRHAEWKDEAALLDWWLVALGHDGRLGYAWRIGEHLSDHGVGESLAELLTQTGPGLIPALRGPLLRQEVRKELESFLEHLPRLKKAPGPELLREVCSQVRELLDADREGRDLPRIALLDLDPQAYASSERGTMRLQHRLKVWNSLVKHVSFLQDRCRTFRGLAKGSDTHLSPLPPSWRQVTDSSSMPKLAAAVLGELDQLLRSEEHIPPLLRPEFVLSALATPPKPASSTEHRALLLAPIDEARAASPQSEEPAWATRAHAEIEELRKQIRTLLTQARSLSVEDAVEGLEIALDELLQLRIKGALDFQSIAKEAIADAHADDVTRRKSAELGELQAVLQELGEPQDGQGGLDEQIGAAQERLAGIRADLTNRRNALGMLLVPEPHKAGASERLEAASSALNSDKLTGARRHLDAAEEFIQAARAAAQSALLPGLNDLATRVGRAQLSESERRGFQELLERIGLRAEEELPYEPLLQAAETFTDAAESKRLHELPVICEVGRPKGLMTSHEVHVLAWLQTGIPYARDRLERTPELPRDQLSGLTEGQLFAATLKRQPVQSDGRLAIQGAIRDLPDGTWSDIVPVGDLQNIRLSEVAGYAGSHDMSSRFFCTAGEWVLGPLDPADNDRERPLPEDPRGFVARLSQSDFQERYGVLKTPSKRNLTPHPPDLDELLELDDAQPVDHQDAAATELWLANLLDASSGVDPGTLAKALTLLEAGGSQLPRPILRSRVARLSDFLAVSRDLRTERERAAASYLETEDGQRQVQRAAERLAARQTEVLQVEVERRRAELEGELQGARDELERLDSQLRDATEREHRAKAELEERLDSLKQQVQDAEALLGDRKTRLLVELLGTPSNGRVAPDAAEPLRAAPEELHSVASLEEAFQHLRGGLEGWQEFDVANLLVTLLTNPWTVLAGPPGVGKSSFARAVLTSLGHGPKSKRYLELVVRRDWHDDAPLFGFWHPEQSRWCPSSEGLAEHLLTALDDERSGMGGFYPCVLEELNLAPPEHYLARLISALEDRDPRIRLYAPTQSPSNQARYPNSFDLPGNVRLLGTVNVDETVQALSPRFLSRAAVIWMAPDMARLLTPPAAPEAPAVALSWSAMVDLLPQERPELGPLLTIVRYLHDHRVPGAPTPRTLRGMERYLAAARELMPETVAQDFQVAQRILPTLRGVGERYREIYDGLAKLLRKNGWTQAATRCEEICSRGEELGDFYDFFHA